MKIEDYSMIKIYGGGLNITGSIINYFTVFIKTVYGIGQGLGGAVRRIATKKVCSI